MANGTFSPGRARSVEQTVDASAVKKKRPDGNLKVKDEEQGKWVDVGAVAFANHDQTTGELQSYSILTREGYSIAPNMKVKLFLNKPKAEQE